MIKKAFASAGAAMLLAVALPAATASAGCGEAGEDVVIGNVVISCGPTPATYDVYSTPGAVFFNGHYWDTKCEKYSSTVDRCWTNFANGSQYFEGADGKWNFNNLTYLPSPRETWRNNPLGGYGVSGVKTNWTATDGRKWRSECDTPVSGRGGCRAYTWNGKSWVVNNIVRFS